MNIDAMLHLYEDSYFKSRDFVPAERVLSPADKARAEAEYEADPVKCLLENVEESRQDVRETDIRMRHAKQDGLLDRDLYRSATKEERKRWRTAIVTLKGDHARAVAELAHWRDYVQWAMEQRRDPRLPREAA